MQGAHPQSAYSHWLLSLMSTLPCTFPFPSAILPDLLRFQQCCTTLSVHSHQNRPINSRATPQVPRPPATFLSLPRELHTLITYHIDKTTALSLLTVCRQLIPVAEQRIWRDINLVLPQHYGEFPLIRPHGPHSSRYCDWAKREATAAEERRRMATKEHVKDIITRGSRERFGMVEHVSIEPAKGVNNAILQFLDFVADNIKTLVLSDVERHVFDAIWRPQPYQTFLYKLFDFEATFSNLTHLDLALTRNDYFDDVWTIIRLAPNLHTLKLDATEMDYGNCFECEDCGRNDRPRSAQKITLPNLVRLETQNLATMEYSNDWFIDDILEGSPRLAYLSVNIDRDWDGDDFPAHLWDRDRLVYLDWVDPYLVDFTTAAQQRASADTAGSAGALANLETLITSHGFYSCSEERLEVSESLQLPMDNGDGAADTSRAKRFPH